MGSEHADLRRVSVFDSAAAQHRVSQSAPFEFRPSGFDVFPEMVRVYEELGKRLAADIQKRRSDTNFSASFIGEETIVSKEVASLGVSTKLTSLKTLRGLAVYGSAESARLAEVDKQLTALKSKSPAELIVTATQAKQDIELLILKLTALAVKFTLIEAQRRNELAKAAKEASELATTVGSEAFKRPFFKAVGSPEWKSFAKTAHALARKEGAEYPSPEDRCLLCERPFDEELLSKVVYGFVMRRRDPGVLHSRI